MIQIQIQIHYYYKFKCYYQNIRILMKNSIERGNTKVTQFFQKLNVNSKMKLWSYISSNVRAYSKREEKKRREKGRASDRGIIAVWGWSLWLYSWVILAYMCVRNMSLRCAVGMWSVRGQQRNHCCLLPASTTERRFKTVQTIFVV